MNEQIGLTPDKIKEFRLRKNLSQEKLAGMLGVSVSTVIRWEQGSAAPTGTAAAVLAAITAGLVGPAAVLGMGALGLSAFGIYGALKEVFDVDTKNNSSSR